MRKLFRGNYLLLRFYFEKLILLQKGLPVAISNSELLPPLLTSSGVNSSGEFPIDGELVTQFNASIKVVCHVFFLAPGFFA